MPYKDPIKEAECKKHWRENNKAQDKLNAQAYYLKNKAKILKRQQEWRASRPEHAKAKRREQTIKRYGITVEQYDAMHREQQGCCKICGRNEAQLGKTLCIDHCHATSKVRWLLCIDCNTGLGKFQDSPAMLRKAADLLEQHQASLN